MFTQNRIRQIIFAVALAATLLALFMSSLIPTARADSTIEVDSTADAILPATDGFCTLREAIINANNTGTYHDCSPGSSLSTDVITFTASLVGDIILTSPLPVITGNLTINGLKGMTGKQTISGADAYRVFEVASSVTFNLSNVRVTNGAATGGGGGGLYICSGCVAVVNTSVFSNNSADDGGAIYNRSVLTVTESAFISNTAASSGGAIDNSGDLVVNSSSFISNTADGAGAIYSGGSTKLSVVDSTFTANRAVGGAGFGGGAINSAGNVTTLDDTTFTGNSAIDGEGGAVNVSGSVLNVTRSDFINNTAQYGGGINTNANSGIVSDTTFTGNSATENGGAIYGRGLVADSTFTHNSANQGGAIFTQSRLTLDHSDLVSNTAQSGGAAAVRWGGALTVTASTFVTNSATYGGAIWLGDNSSQLKADGCTFTGSAAQYGGAIYNAGAFTLTNSTLVSNTAGDGGALHSSSSMAIFHSTFSGNGGPSALYCDTGTLTLANSIVAGSTAANCGGTITGGNNLQYGGTDTGTCGSVITTTNPQLGPLAANGGETLTMALPEGSPALNLIPGAGGCGVGVTTDQRGVARPQGGLCDIGAYEKSYNAVYLPVVLK